MRRFGAIAVLVFALSSLAVAQATKEIRDPAEYNSYVSALQVTNPEQRIAALEEFLTLYPNSVAKEAALEHLMGTYQELAATDPQRYEPKVSQTANLILHIDPNNSAAVAALQGRDAETRSSVPPPGPLTNMYRGHGITFSYPSNWSAKESRGQITVTAPGATRVAPDGQEHFSHGVLVGFAQLSASPTIVGMLQKLFEGYQKANPSFREIGERRSNQVGNQSVITTGWADKDPYLGEEGGLLLLVQEEHGYLWWLMVAPLAEVQQYTPTFVAIAGHIHFEGGTQTEAGSGSGLESQALLDKVVARLRHNRLALPSFQVVMTGEQEINAHASPSNNTITVPEMMIRFLENDEGELAFVISHEIGHLEDRACPQLATQVRMTAEGRSRFCEASADEIGVQYLVGAGYNPFDAAALFGRLMMFEGDTGLLSNLISRFLSDHPLNIERIGDLRRTLQAFCTQDQTFCLSH